MLSWPNGPLRYAIAYKWDREPWNGVCLPVRPPIHFHQWQAIIPIIYLSFLPEEKINRRLALPMQAMPSNRSGSSIPYRSWHFFSTEPFCSLSYYLPMSVEPPHGWHWLQRGWFSLFRIYFSSGNRSDRIRDLGFVWRRLGWSTRLRCWRRFVVLRLYFSCISPLPIFLNSKRSKSTANTHFSSLSPRRSRLLLFS